MSNQTIVIDLPENVYEQYKRRAGQTQRTVEAEIKATLTKDVGDDENEELSPELKTLVDQLTSLDTKHLTRLAIKTFPKKEAARIESLHYTEQSVGLTEKETSDLIELMKKFDRWFVLRNAAVAILVKKGLFDPKTSS